MANSITNFIMQPQEQDKWCWAAVAASVTNFFRQPQDFLSQADLATEILGTSCGQSPNAVNVDCDKAESLTVVLDSLHRLAATPLLRPLQFTEISAAIDAGFPIPLRIVWDDDPDTAHFVVISGYISGAVPRVQVDDPFYGRSVLDYDMLVYSYQGVGQWERTYPVSGGQQ